MDNGDRKRKPFYLKHENGVILPGCEFNPDRFKWSLNFVPDDDDVFICTYPKCGTTWTMNILYMLRNRGKGLNPGENLNRFIPHIECDGPDALEGLVKPRLIKTHLPYRLVPKNSKAKYIYIARNPKDCCVSFYHHTKGFPRYYDFEDGTFDDYFELFIAGEVDCNDYFDHLLSWMDHKNDPNVLFLLYEEMKTDIRASIMKMATFLGGVFNHSCQDADVLNEVIEKTDFGAMKANLSMWSSERSKQFEPFIRRGEIGDWRSHFNEDQSKRMDAKFQSKLAGTEAEHLWKNFDCSHFKTTDD